jgi:transposase-like protein
LTKGKIKVTEKCPLCGRKSVKTVYHTEAGVVLLSEYLCPTCGRFVRMNFLISDQKEPLE